MEKRRCKNQLNTFPRIIVITGAESTGKSALTQWLADYFQVPAISEFAREYIENLDRKYTCRDVENIARKQIDQLNSMKKLNCPYIFSDTWLIITKIWLEVVFNRRPFWIDSEIRNTPIDLFLICSTDLPWEPDRVRENGGKQREILQHKYIDTIKEYNFNYAIVHGKNNERFANALDHVLQLESK